MSFFEELKRRNVFRVGVAYVIVAWLLLQVSDTLVPALHLPEWFNSGVAFVLIIGFPIAIIFAWAFEMTPEGLKKEKDVDRSQSIVSETGRKLDRIIIGVLTVTVAYLLIDKLVLTDSTEKGSEPFSQQGPVQVGQAGDEKRDPTPVEAIAQAQTEAKPTIARQSIAVLPFDSRSDRREDEFFAEGIHDDLLTTIAKISSLKVISRTSVMEYKDTTKKIPQIAAELGVAHVLEGGIQRSGNAVRINVQLIDANTDEHLWAEIFDRELTAENLFAIQSEITRSIADALHAKLSPEEEGRINTMPTQNLAALEAYQRGRQLMDTRNSVNLEEATKEFKTAVGLDPEFAQAWVGIAQSYFHLSTYGTFDSKEADAIGREAIEKALVIDNRLGHAYAVLALIEQRQNKFDEAEALYRKAIELDPNNALAHMWFSGVAGRDPSRAQEQIDLVRRAVELDPRSAIIRTNLGGVYQQHGRYSLAESELQKVLEMHPDFEPALESLAGVYSETGQLDQAIRYFRLVVESDPGNPASLLPLALIYLNLGETEKARELRERLEELDPGSVENGWLDIDLNLYAGNHEGAREAMNWMMPKAQQNGDPLLSFAFFETIIGTPGRAREIFLASDPGWVDPASWKGLIEQFKESACLFSWLLMQTGDPELGQQLLQQTTIYLTEELPAIMVHADWFASDLCHLVAGDKEKAYAAIETRLSHGHQPNFRIFVQLPIYDQVRHEPRMLDLLTRFDQYIEEQRLLVAKLDEEAGS